MNKQILKNDTVLPKAFSNNKKNIKKIMWVFFVTFLKFRKQHPYMEVAGNSLMTNLASNRVELTGPKFDHGLIWTLRIIISPTTLIID